MNTIKKLISIPSDLVEAIKLYKEKNSISTFTAALLELVRIALKKEGLF